MTLDYATEAKIREACEAAGVLPVAIEDFYDDFRAFRFGKVDAEIATHIERMKTEKPHRFVMAGTENNELYVKAFGPERNITAQGTVVKLVGEDRAAQIAASFGTTLGGKSGTVPDSLKKGNGDDHSTNPFLKLRRPDGTIDPVIAERVAKMAKALPAKKLAGIAAAVGKTVTGLPLRTN